MGFNYQNNQQITFLQNLREYSLDVLNSRSVREFENYNYKKINSTVTNFYKGETNLSNEVDWWLSFESFRQQIQHN